MFDFDNSCSTCDFGDKQPHAFGFSITFPYDVEQLYIVIFALVFIFVYIGHPCLWNRHLSTTFSGASKPLFLRPSVRGCFLCSAPLPGRCHLSSFLTDDCSVKPSWLVGGCFDAVYSPAPSRFYGEQPFHRFERLTRVLLSVLLLGSAPTQGS